MSEDLQSLLEKINRDGIEKARAEAEAVISKARAEAAAIVDNAKKEAASSIAAAREEAKTYAERAGETIAQAGRDTLISVENSVTAMLEKLLLASADKALSDGATASEVLRRAIVDFAGGGEISSAPMVASALAAEAAKSGGFTVSPDENLRSGFTVKTDGGRVEHSFTGETLAAELSRRLRPELAQLVGKGQ
jgi:V/A-type H+-transporting ATPase subunit E